MKLHRKFGSKKSLMRIFVLTMALLIIAALSTTALLDKLASYIYQPAKSIITLKFEIQYKNKLIQCGQAININNKNWKIDTLGFFVSGISLNTQSSHAWYMPNLNPSDWQTSNTALIWSPNNCDQARNLNIDLPIGDINFKSLKQLKFSLAIPFNENHANPINQPSPINFPEMFWSWRLGHKFLRLDASSNAAGLLSNQASTTPSTKSDNWAFHLGSLGCKSSSVMRAPISECEVPNRYDFIIDLKAEELVEYQRSNQALEITVAVNLEQLLSQVEPTAANTCMFNATQKTSCNTLTHNLRSLPIFEHKAKIPND